MTGAKIDFLFQQAVEHQNASRLDQAESLYRHILSLDPNHADALNSLAILAQARSDLPAATELLRAAIAVRPNEPSFHFNFGALLAGQGKAVEAIEAFTHALHLNPAHSRAALNLGYLHYEVGDLTGAISAWKIALAATPDDSQLNFALGSALRESGSLAEAIPLLEKSARLSPHLAEPANNLGLALRDSGNLDAAIETYRRLTSSHPDFAEGWNNLGLILLETARHDDAHTCLRTAVNKNAGPQASSNMLYSMLFNPRFGPEQIYQEHVRWSDEFARDLKPAGPSGVTDLAPDRPLRIGYVSPNFRNHVVGRFMLPLCTHHDHTEFKTYFYDDNSGPDSVTAQLQTCVGVWRHTRHLGDADLASVIVEDRIDILVDLNMHMESSRLLVFARKPAPIQVTYLAYAGTTGLKAIDYRLTDPWLDPVGSDQSIYSEQSVRLPRTYWCYATPEEAPQVNRLPADSAGFITFGCLNSFSKINVGVLEIWAAILRSTPGSRLVLHSPEGSHRQMVTDEFVRNQIASDRVTFVPRTAGRDYFRNTAGSTSPSILFHIPAVRRLAMRFGCGCRWSPWRGVGQLRVAARAF